MRCVGVLTTRPICEVPLDLEIFLKVGMDVRQKHASNLHMHYCLYVNSYKHGYDANL